jgi:hypothetical protein
MQQAGAPYPPEVVQRVNEAIQRLRERGALKDDRCPRCGTDNWDVDFIAIPSMPLPTGGLNVRPNIVLHVAVGPPSSYIPALMLVCTNCGNTLIHNLKALGLAGGE